MRTRHLALPLVAALLALPAAGATAAPADPDRSARPTAPGRTTELTLRMPGCEGCEVGPVSAHWVSDQDIDVWQAEPKKVADGVVVFEVPTERTAGLSITLDAPWEKNLPYITHVAMRYGRMQPAERISFAEARAKKRATGCWAGTHKQTAELKVRTRRIRTRGNVGPAVGTIAWVQPTAEWMRPMHRVQRGVLGAQDVFVCGEQP